MAKEDNVEEERLFFTNVLTIITIMISLLLTVEAFLGQTVISLNGSNPPTPQQVRLTISLQQTTAIYFGAIFLILISASFLRFLASTVRVRSRRTKRIIRTISFTLLIFAFILIGYLIGIYAGFWSGI